MLDGAPVNRRLKALRCDATDVREHSRVAHDTGTLLDRELAIVEHHSVGGQRCGRRLATIAPTKLERVGRFRFQDVTDGVKTRFGRAEWACRTGADKRASVLCSLTEKFVRVRERPVEPHLREEAFGHVDCAGLVRADQCTRRVFDLHPLKTDIEA